MEANVFVELKVNGKLVLKRVSIGALEKRDLWRLPEFAEVAARVAARMVMDGGMEEINESKEENWEL
jgi:hypothetical protein